MEKLIEDGEPKLSLGTNGMDIQLFRGILIKYMNDLKQRPFPSITLKQLAEMLKLTSHHVAMNSLLNLVEASITMNVWNLTGNVEINVSRNSRREVKFSTVFLSSLEIGMLDNNGTSTLKMISNMAILMINLNKFSVYPKKVL